MSSMGSYRSTSSSVDGLPIRVNLYRNGSVAGNRCVLDREVTLELNIAKIAKRLGVYQYSNPILYTSQGARVDSMDEVIENESLYLEPNGLAFKGGSIRNMAAHASNPRTLARRNSLEYDFQFKFIQVGSTGTGKSCILSQFTEGRFRQLHEATICVDFGTSMIDIGGKLVKCQVWDTAGQEDFLSITRAYYRETAGALVVFDVTDRQSFQDIKTWLARVRENTSNREICMCLVANKVDLDAQRVVTSEEGEDFARLNQMLYVETSARTGSNVQEAFKQTASAIMRKVDQGLIDVNDQRQGVRKGEMIGSEEVESEQGGEAGENGSEKPVQLNQQQGGGLPEGCCF